MEVFIMNIDLNKIIKDLSYRFDADSKDSFISVYFNRLEDESFLRKRIHTCKSLLKGKEKENFIKTIEKINDFLKNNHETNIAIFASEKHDLFLTVSIPIDINNALIVDSSPYIRPLARILDEWESYSLVLLNTHHAKIFSIELGVIDQRKNLSSEIINKHKKGGWSQARFQRIRKGAIHDFFSEVIDYLGKKVDEQIVLAGPGVAKTQFRALLPEFIEKRVVGIIDIDIEDEREVIKKSLRMISEKEDLESHKLVEQLKKEILKNGLAVYGFDETLQAARIGQIDVLLVEKDYKLKGCLCEHCQILKSGPIKDCPVCGGPMTEADVIEEIIEFAERTDARIEFTDDEEMSLLGHIGGLLRYKIK
jgi:peptide chain release factor subunit 1